MSYYRRIQFLVSPSSLSSSSLSATLLNKGWTSSTTIRTKSSSSSSSDYQYLHHSKLRTQTFQKSLPRLPVPELDKTCGRYLEALKPIIPSATQYQETVKVVKDFEAGAGKELHETLVKQNKQNKHTSYISKPWFDMYLKSRLPLVLNYNPFMAFKDDPNPAYNKQTIRATNMLISAMRFRRSLIDNVLEPEVFHMNPAKSDNNRFRLLCGYSPSSITSYVAIAQKAFPLDMSQFESLFSSTRIPRKGRDVLSAYPESKHMAILRGGQFYVFDILENNGDLKSPQYIHSCVDYISKLKIDETKDSITILSSEERDVWAEVRDKLVTSSASNLKSLERLDSAQFLICLDDIGFKDESELLDSAHNYLHGLSVKQGNKAYNRWFDKSFGFILDNEGHASITFEHSWGDGVAVLRAFNEVYMDSTKNHYVGPETAIDSKIDANSAVQHLEFNLDGACNQAVKAASDKLKKTTSVLDLNYLKYTKMNRNYLKKKKLSPDSVFQLAVQMAFFKVYASTVPTYESCSTSAFKHGRTEVVRSATVETKSACEAFAKKEKSPAQLREMMEACSKKHFQLTKEAAMGQGFDRHLFAMRIIAEGRGLQLPALYRDKSYGDSGHFVLSTSTLYGEYFSGGGFGPVVEDGYGLGYGFIDDLVGIFSSNYKPHRKGKQFVEAFGEALDDVHAVLEKC